MKRFCPFKLLILSTLLLVMMSFPQRSFAAELVSVSSTDYTLKMSSLKSPKELLLSIDFSSPEITGEVFTLSNPSRTVIDLSPINDFTIRSYRELEEGLSEVRLGSYEGKQRIVLEFPYGSPFSMNEPVITSDSIHITFGQGVSAPLIQKGEFPELSGKEVVQNSDVVPLNTHLSLLDEKMSTPLRSSFELSSDLRETKKQQQPLPQKATSSFFEGWGTTSVDSSGSVWLLVMLIGLLTVLFFLFHLLMKHSKQIHIEEENYDKMETKIITLPSLREAYKILGCSNQATNTHIKTRYRHLVKVFHHDALHPKELPRELLEVSRREFDKVRAAYSRLKIERPEIR